MTLIQRQEVFINRLLQRVTFSLLPWSIDL